MYRGLKWTMYPGLKWTMYRYKGSRMKGGKMSINKILCRISHLVLKQAVESEGKRNDEE